MKKVFKFKDLLIPELILKDDIRECVYKLSNGEKSYIGSCADMYCRLYKGTGHVKSYREGSLSRKGLYVDIKEDIDSWELSILYRGVDFESQEEDLILKNNSIINGYNSIGGVSLTDSLVPIKFIRTRTVTRIPKRLVKDYLNAGWELITSNVFYKFTNGVENVNISEFEVDSYLSEGYYRGQTNSVKKVPINNTITKEVRMVEESSLEEWIGGNWVKGTGTTKGRTWIRKIDLSDSKMISLKEETIPEGWEIGNIPHKRGKKVVNKEGISITIEGSELDDYISKGYSPGFYKKPKTTITMFHPLEGDTIESLPEDFNSNLKLGYVRKSGYKTVPITDGQSRLKIDKEADISYFNKRGWYRGVPNKYPRVIDESGDLLYGVYESEVPDYIEKGFKILPAYKEL